MSRNIEEEVRRESELLHEIAKLESQQSLFWVGLIVSWLIIIFLIFN